MKVTIKPMKVEVPHSQLDDLRRRLENTRWPQSFFEMGRDYGKHTECKGNGGLLAP